DAAHQVLPGRFARDVVAARGRAARASTMGDRAAVSGTQGRDWPRSLRRPQPAGVAASRRADRHRLQLSPNGTAATGTDAPDVAARPRHHPRGTDRAFLHDATPLFEVDAPAQGRRAAKLTK